MAKFWNVGFRKFQKDTENKKLVLWGAGKLVPYYIRTFCKERNIIAIIDKDENLHGKSLLVDGIRYPIISDKEFLKQLRKNVDLQSDVAIFITPMSYAGEIMKHIEGIADFDNMNCYVGALMREFCERSKFEFSKGEEKIPRKLHYCWFGKNEIPDRLKRYMESWHKFCPDFEIIRWDETNYDISKNNYMREAYECEKWGFVPDYARLDIIYREGGVYLDTDVELLAPLDKVLKDEMFCGFSCNFQIGFGVGFGAVREHPLIKELRDYYDGCSFYEKNGEINLKTCYEYQHPVLEKFGFHLENSYQKKEGVVVYPSEVFAPEMGFGIKNYTENTIAVHRSEYSWASKEERKVFTTFKEEVKKGSFVINSENLPSCSRIIPANSDNGLLSCN